VVPAHNEEKVLGRLLAPLTAGGDGVGPLEVVVVCNGCTDGTAEVAAQLGPCVRVVEQTSPSKREALRRGDAAATAYPRLFVDADVELDRRSVSRLLAALREPGVHAVAPRSVLPHDGLPLVVRWYYQVWQELPQVRSGLFGRGVIAVTEVGAQRLRQLPAVMSDDLAASEAFAPAERRVVEDAVVVVHPPRTVADLLRRRVRVVTGNAEADRAGTRGAGSRTSPRTLAAMAARRPSLLPKLVVFLGVTLWSRVVARQRIRRGDFSTWLRDDSSRA
jgi:glycosyltransferase involved in cell wall biosynthesis